MNVPASQTPANAKIIKWLLVIAIIVGFAALWWSGALAQLSDINWIRAKVEAAGWLGPLLFLLLVIVLFPLFLAGPLLWISGTIWPLPLAIAYSCTAALLASFLYFFIARGLGQEWAARHIPAKIREYEAKLEAYPARTIMALRLFLGINPAVDFLIAITKIPTASYLIFTTVVFIPSTAMQVAVATLGFDFVTHLPVWVLAVLSGMVALTIGALIMLKRRKARQDDARESTRTILD
jgi:uncharacterized membrane protein YdjX (TVP38/TMEM64 family)